MSYQIIKTFVYVVSVMLSMWGLSCFNFDNIIFNFIISDMGMIMLGY